MLPHALAYNAAAAPQAMARDIAMGNQYPHPRPLERSAIRSLLQDAFEGIRPIRPT